VKDHCWALEVGLAWDPELRFYERKYQIIHSLQDLGLAVAFRAGESSEIGVRLGDQNHELVMSVQGIRVAGSGPDADIDRLIRASSLALEEVRPKTLHRMWIRLAYVVPIDEEYDAARRACGRAVLGGLAADLALRDFATILDGVTRDDEMSFTCEFGVVSAAEVPDRLARRVGQIAAAHGRSGTDVVWKAFRPPPVALFVDTHFVPAQVYPSPETPSWEVLKSWLSAAQDESTRLVDKLRTRVLIGERE